MTFEKLKELIEKHTISSDVKLLSDSGWQFDKTEIDGVFYNREEDYILFTREFDERKYLRNDDYIMLDEKRKGLI